MDFVFWIILIVLIVGVVWWLLNRRRSSDAGGPGPVRTDGGLAGGSAAASAEAAGTAGMPSAAGFGKAAEPVPPTTAEETAAQPEPAALAEPVAAEDQGGSTEQGESTENAGRQTNDGEWETKWSEAGGSSAVGASQRPAHDQSAGPAATPAPEASSPEDAGYVHHPEYTAPHSPTLPGAESAAAEAEVLEAGAAETQATTETSQRPGKAAVTDSVRDPEPAATYIQAAPEPSGHLAADQPYGAGSASSNPDGSGPAEYTVKGDAGTMVYYEEGHGDYEQAKADVWFESAAHAEAAGFRAPRRTRV